MAFTLTQMGAYVQVNQGNSTYFSTLNLSTVSSLHAAASKSVAGPG
jgi:hypothetical protein